MFSMFSRKKLRIFIENYKNIHFIHQIHRYLRSKIKQTHTQCTLKLQFKLRVHIKLKTIILICLNYTHCI